MSNATIRKFRPLWTILAAAFLLLASAYFRLPDLGELGFYGDEETTSLVARSVAEGNGFKMPSGLPYYRAIPLTILNSVSASWVGVDKELSYRIPAAVFGTLTPLALFFLSRGLVPSYLALVAASLLAFSEWHIITSREARMYAPYMLCFLSTGLLYIRWADSLNYYRAGMLASLVALTLLTHTLGLLVVLFPLAWLVLKMDKHSKFNHVLAFFTFAVVFYFLVNELVILRAFSDWISTVGQPFPTDLSQSEPSISSGTLFGSIQSVGLGTVGLFIGAWLGQRLVFSSANSRPRIVALGIIILAMCFGSFFLSANFYAAGITATSLLLVQPVNTYRQFSQCRGPLILLLIIGVAVAWNVLASADSLTDLKKHFLFPYPYFSYFWKYSPGLMILFCAGVISSIYADQEKWAVNIRIFSLVAIGIVAGLGVFSRWGGMRYLIGAYPFLLLVASYPIFTIQSYIIRHGTTARYLGSTFLLAVVLSGVVTSHSLGSATDARELSYGRSNHALTLGFEVYPDHQGAGLYVIQHADEADIIVVEDALQQYWYIGQDVVWLRDEVSNGQFMYLNSAGELRDIYVNSRVLRSAEVDAICNNISATIWLVTSAESEFDRNLYLSDTQHHWLKLVERTFEPEYVARDDITAVYRLSCRRLSMALSGDIS